MTAFDPSIPPLVAHRGAPLNYPENSLAGYKAVLNMALLYPEARVFLETDIRLSKDKVCVGLHDKKLDRTHEAKGFAHAYDLKTLQGFKPRVRGAGAPIDFAALKKQEGSDAPLLDIRPEDARAPSLNELLELTATSNALRTKRGGTPVGICIDLKDTDTFTPLADTLNSFFAAHPQADIPLFNLGIDTQVKPASLDVLWAQLAPEVQQRYYSEPISQTRRGINLLTDMSGTTHGRILSSAVATVVANGISDWHFHGDPDPSHDFSQAGVKGRPLKGNYPSCGTLREVSHALKRQDLVWVDNAPQAIRYVAALTRGTETMSPLPYEPTSLGRPV